MHLKDKLHGSSQETLADNDAPDSQNGQDQHTTAEQHQQQNQQDQQERHSGSHEEVSPTMPVKYITPRTLSGVSTMLHRPPQH